MSGKYTLRVDWTATQNVADNTSRITCNMYLIQANSCSIGIATRSDNSTTINGTAYTWASPAISNSGGKTTKLATVTSETIPHNADGTKSTTISAVFNIRATISGTYYSSITASQTVTLDTIPRATQPTVSASSVDMGAAVTIGTPRASSSFTHDLAYAFAGGSYVSIASGVGTSYSWTVPDLASQIPSATSGTVTIRCVTKNGSTTIGTKTVLLTAKVPSSVVPTISAVTLTEQTTGLTAQFGAFVQGKSTIKVAVSASGAKGSTIKSYSTTFEGNTYTAQTFTTPAVQGSGSLTMTTSVIDSRNRIAAKKTTVTVLPYTLPVISSFRAVRTTAAGEADPNGTTVTASYSYAVAPLGEKNTASMKIEYKRSTEATWTATGTTATDLSKTSSVQLTQTFSTDYQFDMRITVTDWFGASSTYAAFVPSGAVILDIRANGLGIAFGKVCERNGVEFGWPAKGQVLGLGEATANIQSGDDLNDYKTIGVYSISTNAIANSLTNCPTYSAGTLRVYSGLGVTDTGGWWCIIQEYQPYNVSLPTYRRTLQRDGSGNWTYGAWYYSAVIEAT